MISTAWPVKLVSERKISPALTASFSASILERVCLIDDGKVSKSIHHRVREISKKLKSILSLKTKIPKNKKNLQKAIDKYLHVRELSKELENLGTKLLKASDKFIGADIKNAIHLAKGATKSALENIKVNKKLLRSF